MWSFRGYMQPALYHASVEKHFSYIDGPRRMIFSHNMTDCFVGGRHDLIMMLLIIGIVSITLRHSFEQLSWLSLAVKPRRGISPNASRFSFKVTHRIKERRRSGGPSEKNVFLKTRPLEPSSLGFLVSLSRIKFVKVFEMRCIIFVSTQPADIGSSRKVS